jgi:peroxiredoxin Q/BCP
MAGWVIGAIVLLAVGFALEERSGLLRVGTQAPDFAATLSIGNRIALRDYRGKNPVVLFFYPADFTQGCTEQVCAFRDSYKKLEEAGAVLIGVSNDTDSSHVRFSQTFRLPFPLISDPDRTISKAYNVERLGGIIALPKRVTYVIDKEGTVRAAIHHEIMIGRHVTDVLEVLKKIGGR